MSLEGENNGRYYKPIWDRIKAEGTCSISVPKELFRRIKKAVGKEKLLDVIWRSRNDKKLVFKEGKTKDGKDKLVITLKPNFNVRNIV